MSMMTATYPLAGVKSERPHTAATLARRAWGFWATSGWFTLALVTYLVASVAVGFFYVLGWLIVHNSNIPVDFNWTTAELIGAAIATPAGALLLVLLSRKRGWTVREYLNLTMPSMRHVAYGLGALVAFGALTSLVAYFYPALDQSGVTVGEYRTIMGSVAGLSLYWLVIAVTAPVGEEIAFRGFLMRGWGDSRLGGIGALVLSAVVFASVHPQYNLPGMALVCGLGLMFGAARLWSGSTVLSIMMHAAWNIAMGVMIAMAA
jgi:membrane protease YdiL (CAAX protease family)